MGQYEDKTIPSLKFSASDAKAIYTWLVDPFGGGVPKDRALLMTNEQARGTPMKVRLRDVLDQAGPEDELFLFFTGHGVPRIKEGGAMDDGMLLPYDADNRSTGALEESGVKLNDLKGWVNRSKAKTVFLALDACFSGTGEHSFSRLEGGKGFVVEEDRSILKSIASAPGRALLASSSAKQESFEDKRWGGGLFASFLLKALQGEADTNEDGILTVAEVASFLGKKVPSEARKARGKDQNPELLGEGGFELTYNPRLVALAVPAIAEGKLKKALASGAITFDQATAASQEIKGGKYSHVLRQFLVGKSDAKNFGVNYKPEEIEK